MIITFLVIFSFLRELRKKRNYSFRSSSSRGRLLAADTRENTLTTSDSQEDFLAFTSTSISETIYSSATSATFKLRNESSSICSDITLASTDPDSRRCSEQDAVSTSARMTSRKYIGYKQQRSRYGSRGSLPRRRRTTGRLDSCCTLLGDPPSYSETMMYLRKIFLLC